MAGAVVRSILTPQALVAKGVLNFKMMQLNCRVGRSSVSITSRPRTSLGVGEAVAAVAVAAGMRVAPGASLPCATLAAVMLLGLLTAARRSGTVTEEGVRITDGAAGDGGTGAFELFSVYRSGRVEVGRRLGLGDVSAVILNEGFQRQRVVVYIAVVMHGDETMMLPFSRLPDVPLPVLEEAYIALQALMRR